MENASLGKIVNIQLRYATIGVSNIAYQWFGCILYSLWVLILIWRKSSIIWRCFSLLKMYRPAPTRWIKRKLCFYEKKTQKNTQRRYWRNNCNFLFEILQLQKAIDPHTVYEILYVEHFCIDFCLNFTRFL